jgi:hypothetical protein
MNLRILCNLTASMCMAKNEMGCALQYILIDSHRAAKELKKSTIVN